MMKKPAKAPKEPVKPQLKPIYKKEEDESEYSDDDSNDDELREPTEEEIAATRENILFMNNVFKDELIKANKWDFVNNCAKAQW